MLNRQEITKICIRHMQAAMAVASDSTIEPKDEAKFLYEIITNLANDLDSALSEKETTSIGG